MIRDMISEDKLMIDTFRKTFVFPYLAWFYHQCSRHQGTLGGPQSPAHLNCAGHKGGHTCIHGFSCSCKQI